jgi:uncharacterized phage protein (TIGR01671 family)
MRKIIFRARSLTKYHALNISFGDWVYGSYIESGTDAPSIVFGDGEQCEIDRETLGQYTGLKDKNGKEIYEGDIVEFTDFDFENTLPLRLRIFWDNDNYSWGAAKSLKRDHHKTIGCRGAVWCKFKKVIGNIYESPELLEEK